MISLFYLSRQERKYFFCISINSHIGLDDLVDLCLIYIYVNDLCLLRIATNVTGYTIIKTHTHSD